MLRVCATWLMTGILLPFISGIKGLSLFVMLAVPSTDVLTTFSMRLVDYHYTQAANAVDADHALIRAGEAARAAERDAGRSAAGKPDRVAAFAPAAPSSSVIRPPMDHE